jgi:hypothetical protein
MNKDKPQFGKRYADAIKNNPGRGKNATKARHTAYMDYKKALDEYLNTMDKIEKNT